MRRLLAGAVVCALTLALCAGATATALAEEPAGPRLAFLEWKVLNEALEHSEMTLGTVGSGGDVRQRLVGPKGIQPNPLGGLSWSPDGSELAFVGAVPGSEDSAIYLVGAEGGVPRMVPGTRDGGNPLFSPDGSKLAFSRSRIHAGLDPKHPIPPRSYFSTSTWVVPVGGGKPRQLTPWANGLYASPSSFSPDGRLLALDRSYAPARGPEAVALDLRHGGTTLIAKRAKSPVYSPDGSKVALISYRDGIVRGEGEERVAVGELYVVNRAGKGMVRLTEDPDRQEANPSWDPAGKRIAYVEETAHWAVGLTGVLMQINADGSCRSRLLGVPRREGKYGPPLKGPGFYSPVWQPGPGREAGAISC